MLKALPKKLRALEMHCVCGAIKSKCILILILVIFCSGAASIEFSPEYLNEIAKNYGDYARRRLVSWEKLIKENKNIDERKKLDTVNNFFNLLGYRLDIDHWGVIDYWATPLEFVISGSGDCEDYAVAKYFTLLQLGVPDEKLMIMYVKLLQDNTVYERGHMVLLYYPSSGDVPLVLDIVNKEILLADQRPDLKPIYGFNGTGLWQAKELGIGRKIGASADLKQWADLESRLKSGKISKWKNSGEN